MVLVSLILTAVTGGLGYSFGSFGGSDSASMSKSFETCAGQADGCTSSQITDAIQSLTIPMIVGGIIVCLTVFIVIMAVGILISVFLINPLVVGISRFFEREMKMPGKVSELAYGFDHCYKNVIKIMFFRDLYTFLWSLLLIVPGIVKAYEYRMIPYILGENPEMSKEEAFELSKSMMAGEKWNTFVLDLSFILWYILAGITCGIVGVFYVSPYKNLTNAALYNTLFSKNNSNLNVDVIVE